MVTEWVFGGEFWRKIFSVL